MDIKFITSKQAIFITALLKGSDVEGWVALQNKLWERYPFGYKLLQGKSNDIFVSEDSDNILDKATTELKALIENGTKSAEFSKLLVNVHSYKKWIENEWVSNKEKVVYELKGILRTKLPDGVFTVYVMGDSVSAGRNLGDNKIIWGHKEDWSNYSLVYLAHECLHNMFSHSDLEHAVIELITDNELRIRLNKGGEYFTCEGRDVGHNYLRDIEKIILPNWQHYLSDKSLNIHDFIDSVKPN